MGRQCNQVKAAIDTCIGLHQWNTALDLSKQVHVADISTRLTSHADRLLECGKIADAVQLFRKANCQREAANLLYQVLLRFAPLGPSFWTSIEILLVFFCS